MRPLLVALLFALMFPARATAQERAAFMHVVRPGETLASIAQRYYGDPRRESVLVAENGLTTQGGAAIVVGLRLAIPWVSYHRVRPGQSWAAIAMEHYGDARRVSALIDANLDAAGNQPPEGAELLVPYPLRHVARQGDTVRRVAQLYYDDQGEAQTLFRFNSVRRQRLPRGRIVLVPLADLLLSEEGRAVVEAATGQTVPEGDVRDLQGRINEELPLLREHVRRGRYAEAVALGNRLVGAGDLTSIQTVSIYRELAVAYVALDRNDLAVQAFAEALRRNPDLELDTRRTSPTVLRAAAQAREELANRAEEEEPAEDAGVAPADGGVPTEDEQE